MDIASILASARTHLLAHGSYTPTLFVEWSGGGEGAMLVFVTFESTALQRQKQLFLAGMQIGRARPQLEVAELCLLCEGWASWRALGEPVTVSPSEDPQRMEVLFLMRLVVEQRRGFFKHKKSLRQSVQYVEFIRDGAGDLVDLLSHEELKDAQGVLLPAFLAGFSSTRLPEGQLASIMAKYAHS